MAARAGITVQSMGELVDDLQAEYYRERRPDPHDRRARRIHLIERGRKTTRVATRATADVADQPAELLGQEQYQSLRRFLEQIVAGTSATRDDDERRDAAG